MYVDDLSQQWPWTNVPPLASACMQRPIAREAREAEKTIKGGGGGELIALALAGAGWGTVTASLLVAVFFLSDPVPPRWDTANIRPSGGRQSRASLWREPIVSTGVKGGRGRGSLGDLRVYIPQNPEPGGVF